MIDKNEFNMLSKAYAPIVKNLIESNSRFYRFNEKIIWGFGYDDNLAIMGTCNRKDNIVHLNLYSFMDAYLNKKDLKDIEYFLLHEIRHIFQNLIIKDYLNGKDISIDPEIVKQWIYENDHYIKALDENGNENKNYFLQDIEMDAYAFSYAVMKYKYKDAYKPYVPDIFGKEFYSIVDDWLSTFKEEKL